MRGGTANCKTLPNVIQLGWLNETWPMAQEIGVDEATDASR